MKNFMSRDDNKGWGLIELIVVSLIIGLLVRIAYPQFRNYLVNSRRSEGVVLLLEVMQMEERYFTDNMGYTDDLTKIGYANSSFVESSGGYYKVIPERCDSSSFDVCIKLRAIPQGRQVEAGEMTLDSRGLKEGVWR